MNNLLAFFPTKSFKDLLLRNHRETFTIAVSPPAATFFGRLPLPTDFGGSAASNSLSDSLGWLQHYKSILCSQLQKYMYK